MLSSERITVGVPAEVLQNATTNGAMVPRSLIGLLCRLNM